MTFDYKAFCEMARQAEAENVRLRAELATIMPKRDGAVAIGTQLEREREAARRERDDARDRITRLEAELASQSAAIPGRIRDALALVRTPLAWQVGAPGSTMREAQDLGMEHRAEVERLKRELADATKPPWRMQECSVCGHVAFRCDPLPCMACEVERLKAELVAIKAPRCLTDEEALLAWDNTPGGVPASVASVARAAERKLVGAPLGADTAFIPPFGTVRKCRHCGCLVAGGPTACARCADGSK